jgi:hypothetical protein
VPTVRSQLNCTNIWSPMQHLFNSSLCNSLGTVTCLEDHMSYVQVFVAPASLTPLSPRALNISCLDQYLIPSQSPGPLQYPLPSSCHSQDQLLSQHALAAATSSASELLIRSHTSNQQYHLRFPVESHGIDSDNSSSDISSKWS